MDHEEVGSGGMDWVALALNRNRWRTPVKMEMNSWVP